MSIGFWIPLLFLVAVLSFLAGILAVFWWAVPRIERGYIFRPSRQVEGTPADLNIPFEQLFVETSDGCRLSAWHLCPPDPVGSVVYFHGNGGNLGILVEIFALLYGSGLQVFAVDYRGYGLSDGIPSEQGLLIDAVATVEYFHRHLRTAGAPVVYWGRSLGSAFAAYAASRVSPNALILESAFPSKKSLLRHYPQFRLFYFFSRVRLETLRHLKGHLFPVLLVHGDKDKTIPFEQGQRLYARLTGPKEFFHVQGADHINLHRVDTAPYVGRVLDFIRRAAPPTVH